jgi:hypothetical protein
LKAELETLRNLPGRVGPSHVEIKVNDQLIELFNREDIMWRLTLSGFQLEISIQNSFIRERECEDERT